MLRVLDDAVLLDVRLTPKARISQISGIVSDANGICRIKISVTEPPEDGKANAALCALAASRLKIAKGSVSVVSGMQSRNKTLRIAGSPERLMDIVKKEFVSEEEQ